MYAAWPFGAQGLSSVCCMAFGAQGLSSVCCMAFGVQGLISYSFVPRPKRTPLNGLVHKVEFSALFLECGPVNFNLQQK